MKLETEKNEFVFETIRNNGEIQVMKQLIDLKNIFARQLPKMPREYIVRLVFDHKHESIVIKKNGKIFGGVCYCVFEKNHMVEIVFLAIMSDHQIKGFGTKLMNHLKMQLQKRGIDFLMTCADNLAIGYFKKQGFHQNILMPEILYKGYLKDYEGSTLMECILVEDIDYPSIMSKIKIQAALLKQFLKKKVSNRNVHEGISDSKWKAAQKTTKTNKYGTQIDIDHIKGVKDAGFEFRDFDELMKKEKGTTFKNSCQKFLDLLGQHKSAWPFKEPVKKEDVPDYYDVIKNPIDLQTIKEKLKNDLYKTKNQFVKDIELIFKNAKIYNQPNTIFYKYASELEKFSQEILINLKEENLFIENENCKMMIEKDTSKKVKKKHRKKRR